MPIHEVELVTAEDDVSGQIPRTLSPLRLGAVVALALAAGLVAYFLLRDDDGNSGTPAEAGRARAVTIEELRSFAASAERPVYWAGPRAGLTYELTGTKEGRVYVRYLPPGVPVGDRSTRHLTIATYPWPNAYANTRAAGRRAGHVISQLGRDGVAVWPESGGTNVYFARRGADHQVEIYDPTPGRARALVVSGGLSPVDFGDAVATRAIAPRAASVHELRSLPVSVGHPVFWAGPRSRTTYELTRTDDGRIYIRYLPPGVRAGSRSGRFLTIATYPQPNAFARTSAAAKSSRARMIELGAGEIAFFRPDRPTSVYVARRGLNYQVEVFDPSPAMSRRIVETGKLRPIR